MFAVPGTTACTRMVRLSPRGMSRLEIAGSATWKARSEPGAISMPLIRQVAPIALEALVRVMMRLSTAPRGLAPKSAPSGVTVRLQFSGRRGTAVMATRAAGSLASLE